jgi:dihydrofolate reductase
MKKSSLKKSATKSSSTKKHRPPSRGGHRKVIVYVAVSADWYIARPDGNIDWLKRPHPKGHYGMTAFFASIDTILWGRKTFTEAMEKGVKLSIFGAGIKNYIFSREPQKWTATPLQPDVEFVTEPIKQFAQRLRAQPGKDIFMMGGGEIIAAFLDVGEIDEFSIHVIPVFIGEGIPLIAPRYRNIKLALLSTKTYPDGVVHLNYGVADGRDA